MSYHRCADLYLLFYIGTILNICSQNSACRLGTETECKVAPFVPGYNLAGEGFDVVSLRRKGAYLINVKSYVFENNTCIVCENRLQKGQLQKLPLAVVDWRPISQCSKMSSALHHSVDSLIKSSSSLISNNWVVDLSLDEIGNAILMGSSSNIAKFAQSQHMMDKVTFALQEISCTYYRYRVINQPELSAEFAKHLLQLPKNYNEKTKSKYRWIINTYGTHYIRHVNLGGHVRQVTAFRTCLATLKGFRESEIKNCINIDLKIALGLLPANISISNRCSHILKDNMEMGSHLGFLTQNLEVLGGESYFPDFEFHQNSAKSYRSWINSLCDYPDIISYAISPLQQLVADPELSASLKMAVTEYIEENRLSTKRNRNHGCNLTPNLDHNCCPLQAGHGSLKVMVQRATGLPGDFFSQADCYVKIWYNNIYERTGIVNNNNNPEWYQSYTFGSIEFGHALILEVWDSDVWFDDILGRCVVYPERGSYLRTCRFNNAVFYFTYTAQCDAHLAGYSCERYSPED
ncbi:Perforin-1 [Bagarius yarrelli]|uniref:Perforin-1 n=1 Tax=Bagarius yarrelli TaxID=175774 RepID=A0A556TXN2_BAGYA|nr:Perforin-1 [Bagarius yarrelli]